MTQERDDNPRVLVLAVRLPWPPIGGGDLRALQTVRGLARTGCPVAAFGLERGAEQPPAGVELWRSTSDRDVTEFERLASRSLEWLKKPGGHPYDRYVTPVVTGELEAAVDDFRPDVVVVESLLLGGYVEMLKERVQTIVMSAYNVEAVLQREMLDSIGQSLPAPLAARLDQGAQRFERETLAAVDQIWACSRRDADLIRERYPGAAPARVVANSIDVESYAEVRQAQSRPHRIVFPAQFGYPPNSLAATWLVHELLPLLRPQFPDVELVLTGRDPTPEMTEMGETEPGVTVTGPVPEMRPQLAAASAMAVPLFQGGGTRFKALESLASGLPLVSSAKGVEGIELEPGRHYLAAETPQEFADAVTRLWTDPERRAQVVRDGLELVRERYSWEAATREMRAGLRELAGSG